MCLCVYSTLNSLFFFKNLILGKLSIQQGYLNSSPYDSALQTLELLPLNTLDCMNVWMSVMSPITSEV